VDGTFLMKKICIFKARVQQCPHWDPDSVHTGVSGSEESIIYSAEALKNLGFNVFVLNNLNNKEKYKSETSNPCYSGYLHKNDFFDCTILHDDIEFIQLMRPRTNKLFFFPNNICTKQMKSEEIHALDGVLWTSSYQRNHWVSLNPELEKFREIFGYSLDPTQFSKVQPKTNPYSCIYASDYARGLSILLQIWPNIKEKFPLATLDIYYGLRNWGNISLEEEQSIRNRIQFLKSFGVTDHGLVGHVELATAFSNASLWTYPCTHHETFCITAIKAQLAGAFPVIIEKAALAETVKFGTKCHAKEQYENLLLEAMSKIESVSLEEREQMGHFILENFTWGKMASRWANLF
jgi:glycosyltransferase involved in cell wall biosynthesis